MSVVFRYSIVTQVLQSGLRRTHTRKNKGISLIKHSTSMNKSGKRVVLVINVLSLSKITFAISPQLVLGKILEANCSIVPTALLFNNIKINFWSSISGRKRGECQQDRWHTYCKRMTCLCRSQVW